MGEHVFLIPVAVQMANAPDLARLCFILNIEVLRSRRTNVQHGVYEDGVSPGCIMLPASP